MSHKHLDCVQFTVSPLNKMKKEFYIKIRPIDDDAYCVISIDELSEALGSWLGSLNTEEELAVSMVELTEKEFEALPEYEG